MLVDGRCSIYEHRPRTCRTYDCRVFAAAEVGTGEDQVLIHLRARRWRFGYATEADRTRHAAVRAAAAHLRAHAGELPRSIGLANPTQLALRAIQVHDLFLGRDDDGTLRVIEPDAEAVRTALAVDDRPRRRDRRPRQPGRP
jgi:hypothetical protein